MRRRLFVILATALLAVSVLRASPAAAAEPVCETTPSRPTACLASFAISPSTVDSATGGTVTVTMGLTSTAPTPPFAVRVAYLPPTVDVPEPRIDLQPVAGPAGTYTYRGELTVPPGSKVGALELSYIDA